MFVHCFVDKNHSLKKKKVTYEGNEKNITVVYQIYQKAPVILQHDCLGEIKGKFIEIVTYSYFSNVYRLSEI